eukprot:1282071-Pyramimonas_sp.AAC.1
MSSHVTVCYIRNLALGVADMPRYAAIRWPMLCKLGNDVMHCVMICSTLLRYDMLHKAIPWQDVPCCAMLITLCL